MEDRFVNLPFEIADYRISHCVLYAKRVTCVSQISTYRYLHLYSFRWLVVRTEHFILLYLARKTKILLTDNFLQLI